MSSKVFAEKRFGRLHPHIKKRRVARRRAVEFYLD
jgi:hypothetical protein